MRLSYSQPSNGITVQIELCDLPGMADTDVFIDTTLIDAKQHLLPVDRIRKAVESFHLLFAPHKPP